MIALQPGADCEKAKRAPVYGIGFCRSMFFERRGGWCRTKRTAYLVLAENAIGCYIVLSAEC